VIKLVRNAWGDQFYTKNENRKSVQVVKELLNSNDELIRWDYLEKLYKIEREKGLRAGTKLTIRHIEYSNEKMNAQTLSKSVADSFIFIKTNDSYFKEVDATVQFIQYMNNAFDILNSRTKFPTNPCNKPISIETVDTYRKFAIEFTQYVKGLNFIEYINEQRIVTKVLNSKYRKIGFLGMIIGLKNAINLYEFLTQKNYMTYLLTYKLFQDHIETTFRAIRSRGGYNNNPTCRQFAASYKRILVHSQIVGSVYGNCTILDTTKNLTIKCTTEYNIK